MAFAWGHSNTNLCHFKAKIATFIWFPLIFMIRRSHLSQKIQNSDFTFNNPPKHCAVGVQRHNVSHFKALLELYLDFEAQGRESTFTFCHAHLKLAISHLKMARVRF